MAELSSQPTQGFTEVNGVFKELPTTSKYMMVRLFAFYIPSLVLVIICFFLLQLFLRSYIWILLLICILLIYLTIYLFEQYIWSNTNYKIESNRHEKVADKSTIRPGNIILEVGGFSKSVRIYSIETFQSCRVSKGLIENIFGVGTIVLNGQTRVRLRGISSPEAYILLIQHQFDELKGNLVDIQEQLEIHKKY